MSRRNELPRGRRVPRGNQSLSPAQFGMRGAPASTQESETRAARAAEDARVTYAQQIVRRETEALFAALTQRVIYRHPIDELVDRWAETVDRLYAEQTHDMFRQAYSGGNPTDRVPQSLRYLIFENIPASSVSFAYFLILETQEVHVNLSVRFPPETHPDLMAVMEDAQQRLSHSDLLRFVARMMDTGTVPTYGEPGGIYGGPRRSAQITGVDYARDDSTRPRPEPVSPPQPTTDNPFKKRRILSLD